MDQQYDNTNSFVLFTNDKKETEKQPDYTGSITLEDGTKMRLAAWKRQSQSGKVFLSGKLSEFQEQQPAAAAPQQGAQDSSDLPF